MDPKHLEYVNWVLHELGQYTIHFEYAQPWLHFYVAHVANMLGSPLKEDDAVKMRQALKNCFSQGFGGGFGQLPHLAPTYAAFLAVLELGPMAYDILDRQRLYAFLKKCKKGGRFMMH